MLISDFDAFVQASDQSVGRSEQDRMDIAIYGIASEIGSVIAAVKKRLLAEGGEEIWNEPNEEIVEELGDVIWYCFSLARLVNQQKPLNIFAHDVANLRVEIGGHGERASRIRSVLDPANQAKFLQAAENFPKKTKGMTFEDYQRIAFLTARTADRTLMEVCLALLWQLSAQLFRLKLPQIELDLNKALADRDTNDLLGEIAWHIAALASIYGLEMSTIAEKNREKVSYRLDRSNPTPLHDQNDLETQKFPTKFDIAFVSVGKGRSQMYMGDKQLGDELTDNSYDDDGYRFHDVMHIANVAKLGWSPVLRKLMGRKRKQNAQTDEVEDGARAQIVEEAVVKIIHSEGERLAVLSRREIAGQPQKLFSKSSDITFRFLKLIRNFVVDLEVSENRYWEWEEAITTGYEIFYKLRCEGQGTVSVDLDARSIEFHPDVFLNVIGRVAGLGSAHLDSGLDNGGEADPGSKSSMDSNRIRIQKIAILDSLGIHTPKAGDLAALFVKEEPEKGVAVKCADHIQALMWARKVVGFRTTVTRSSGGGLYCTAIAVATDRRASS